MTDAQDEYERKFDAATQEMREIGIARYSSVPPLIRLLRTCGLMPRPPLYERFWRTVFVQGTVFGLGFGLVMYLLVWRPEGIAALVAIQTSALSGAMFGLGMALYYRWVKSRHSLTDWDTL